MQNTWKTYQEKLLDHEKFTDTNFEEHYSSIRVKDMKIHSVENSKIEGVLFLAESLKEEVMIGTEKQKKKNVKQLRKLLVQFSMIALMSGVGVSLGMLTVEPHTVSAANNIMETNVNTPEITPGTIMDWGLKIALLVVSLGTALSICLLAIAGIYLMITRKRDYVVAWNSDIVKGVIQVLISIPLIYAIFQLAQFIFKNLNFLEGLM